MATKITVRFIGLIVFELIRSIAFAQSVESCPRFCVCDTWYELQRASCTDRHLYSIHTGASSDIQALDLSNNSISALNNFELADAGLSGLKYLNLSGNSISEISLNAFNGLHYLTVLDLSRNHLYYILPEVFTESRSLRILRLSRNNFNSHVLKLQTPWLMELFMDSCQINHLPVDTFHGLPRLRNLDLSNNVMIQLDSAVLQTLHFLRKLSLEGNPWSCNKVMYELEIYLRHKHVEFNPMCTKSQGVKKFEKIVLQPVANVENHIQTLYVNNKIIRRKITPKENESHVLIDKNVTTCRTAIENETKFGGWNTDMTPYWFLTLGFILGFASSMVISYVWLAGKFSCYPKRERHQGANDDPQRLSLLTHLWQFEDLVPSDNASVATSCPGTPPPPYREVVLRPGLYRCPPNGSNLNDNDTGCRER